VAETLNTLSNVMIFLPCVLYGFPMCNAFNLSLRFKAWKKRKNHTDFESRHSVPFFF
jgi:hypothetical protein